MAGIAARIGSVSRQHILREMGVEPLRSKMNAAGDGEARCLFLASAAERDGGSCEKLLQQIVAAAGLPEECCMQLWMQPGATAAAMPAHSCGLVFGTAVTGLGEPVRNLPSLQELLDRPAGKRQVWQALVALRRHLQVQG